MNISTHEGREKYVENTIETMVNRALAPSKLKAKIVRWESNGYSTTLHFTLNNKRTFTITFNEDDSIRISGLPIEISKRILFIIRSSFLFFRRR